MNDARTDPRALANPLVTGELAARFYLGIPLRTRDGFNIGTLCVLDFAPRQVSEHEVAALTRLAALVMGELELRVSARQALSEYHRELLRREQREDHIRMLLRELVHRSKNLLAVVLAIAQQTASRRDTLTIDDYVTRLAARVHGLALTHDLIADEDWRGVTLSDLAARQLAPFVGEDSGRIECEGPRLLISPVAAQNLGLALHELATNAAKYGSLSTPPGRIHLAWHHSSERLHITWRERNGLPAKAPAHKGFGYLVLARLVPEALDGEVELEFDPQGFSWNLDVPAIHIL